MVLFINLPLLLFGNSMKISSQKNNLKIYSLIFILLFWQILSFYNIFDTLPSAFEVFESLYYHLFEDELLFHLFVTLKRVLLAFIISMFLGLFIGILMGKCKLINDLLDLYLIFFLNLPAIVTIMLCYISFGLSDSSAILAVIINKVPIVIVNIRQGCNCVDKNLLEIAKVYKLSYMKSFTKIYLPQIFPYIIISARAGLSLIWKIVLLVELLGRSDGIGFQLAMFFQFFDIASILAYSFTFIFVVLIIDKCLIQSFENRVNKWR